jgi:hypothetical protein
MPAQTRNKKSPIQPVKSHIPSRPTPPLPLRAVPKSAPSSVNELSIEEKAACFDELQSIHLEAQAIQVQLDKLHFKLRGLQGKRDTVLERGAVRSGQNLGEPCFNCGFVACVCER